MALAESTWSLGEASVQGKPVVFKFIDSVPPASLRQTLPWLTIVSWKYDGSENNGMPPPETNRAMIELEDALEKISGKEKLYIDVYSVTGNNLKEFAFYIADREAFMANFNDALRDQPVYPIKVNFYEDKEWNDLAKLHKDFGITRQ